MFCVIKCQIILIYFIELYDDVQSDMLPPPPKELLPEGEM